MRALLDGNLEAAAAQLDVESRFVETIGLEGVASPFHRLAGVRARYYLGRANESLLEEFPGEHRAHVALRTFVRALLGSCDHAIALRARFSGIERPDDATALIILTVLLEASVYCGDRSTAEALRERLAPLANRLDGACLVSFGRMLGQAAILVGRPAEARDAYEQALAVCEKVRFRPELALIHLELAELLLTSSPSERARGMDHLQTAWAEFEAMHMQPSLSRALELGRSVEPARFPRPAARPDAALPDALEPLTEREREVTTLLAQGKSNREIATTLVISESTAEVHVKHILGKLGLRSRSQVAAWATQRGLPH